MLPFPPRQACGGGRVWSLRGWSVSEGLMALLVRGDGADSTFLSISSNKHTAPRPARLLASGYRRNTKWTAYGVS